VFGTSQCKQCSSYYLFLLLPFVIVDIVFVMFLFISNFTINNGSINVTRSAKRGLIAFQLHMFGDP